MTAQRSAAPRLKSVGLEDVSNLVQIGWDPALFVASDDRNDIVSIGRELIDENMIGYQIKSKSA